MGVDGCGRCGKPVESILRFEVQKCLQQLMLT